jgi:hypothetical protein
MGGKEYKTRRFVFFLNSIKKWTSALSRAGGPRIKSGSKSIYGCAREMLYPLLDHKYKNNQINIESIFFGK